MPRLFERTQAKAPAKGVDGLFENYKEAGDDVIGPEGIERLCSDLGVSPTDRRVLVMAWIMGAKRMGFFSRQEFLHGCRTVGASTLAQLKKALPKLDAAIAAPDAFQGFYTFAFQFCLTEPGQKIIDMETAVEMIKIVLPHGRFVPEFCEFLETQTDYKKMNSDQWSTFLKFSHEVHPDMSNANENPSWPLLLDNFVEWYGRRAAIKEGES